MSAAFFSSVAASSDTQSRSDHPAPQVAACPPIDSDSCSPTPTSGETIELRYRDMLMARMEYRIHSDFLAAADYTNAKRAWEQAVDDYTGENT